MATELEAFFEDDVRGGEGGVDVAGVDPLLERKVVTEVGMNDWRAWIQRGRLLVRARQLPPVNLYELTRILAGRPGIGDHHDYRLTGPAGTVHRHGVLRS